MKLKCPLLLKPLGTIIQENYGSFYPSEPFRILRFNMRHPVRPYCCIQLAYCVPRLCCTNWRHWHAPTLGSQRNKLTVRPLDVATSKKTFLDLKQIEGSYVVKSCTLTPSTIKTICCRESLMHCSH